MHPNGVHVSLVGSHRAFPGPQTEHGKRVRPLSFPVIGKRALGKRVARIGRAVRRTAQWASRPLSVRFAPSIRLRNRTGLAVLKQLTQEGLRGNCDGIAVGERINFGVGEVSNHLKGVFCACNSLHRGKCRRWLRIRCLRFRKEPGMPVFGDEKINFVLCLVPDVVKGIVAKSKVVPHVNGLQQMARDKILEPCAFVFDFAPVALIPLGRLADRVFDVSEPRADSEALMEIFQRGNPSLDRCLCDTDFAREGSCYDLIPGTGNQQFRKYPDARNVGNLRKVAKIFAEKLFAAKLAPTEGEAAVPADERLGESAMRPKRIPVIRRDRARRMDFGRFKFWTDKFSDTKRMHVIEEVAPHQTVAAALVDVKPCASRDDKPHAVFVEIEETLEKRLPSDKLVNLVKRDDGFAFGCDSKTGGGGEAGSIARNELACGKVIPCEVTIRKHFGKRRLSALARAGKKSHLSVVLQMLFKDGFVDAFPLESVFHVGNNIKSGSPSQYQTSDNTRMVDTKPVGALEWYRSSTTRKRLARGRRHGQIPLQSAKLNERGHAETIGFSFQTNGSGLRPQSASAIDPREWME